MDNKKNITLPVSEIFYSLQGEGARSGEPSIFIRIQGCKAKHACYSMGIKCDTEFESGKDLRLIDLVDWINKNANGCKWIVWTGGEPADRITDEVAEFFADLGFRQAIETSGLFPVSDLIDFVSISPKVAEHVVEKNFKDRHVSELRYVRHAGQEIPKPSVTADHYFLSPHFDGFIPNEENIRHCVRLCLENPGWKLSTQEHKILNVL